MSRNRDGHSKVKDPNAAARHDWVATQLRSLPCGLRLLDAGCGEQPYRALCSHLEYYAQDFGEYTGTGDGKGLQTGAWDVGNLDYRCDITEIPVIDGHFDVVLCTEVLEHVPDPVAALTELARVLAPSGVLLLTVPFASLTHFAPYHFSTGFNVYFFDHHLPNLGFDSYTVERNGSYSDYLVQEINRWSQLPAAGSRTSSRLLGILGKSMAGIVKRTAPRKGADQLLCFGLHVRAEKPPTNT